MQMTNIARDVREDADRGRSYLPKISDPLATDSDEVKASVVKVLELAEQCYQSAAAGMHYLPWKCRMGVRVAMDVYREIGRQIQRNQFEVHDRRTVISKSRLLVTTLSAMFFSVKNDIQFSTKHLRNCFTHFLKESIMNSPVNEATSQSVSTPTQAKQTVYLGISLTLLMATALFAMVFINPKSSDYSYLPLVYAGVSLFGGLFNRLAARCDMSSD